MSADSHDVHPEQYAMVIREMIRHENDVTNHRVMWLLIGQGFIANAYVSARNEGALNHSILLLAGILVAVSAFLMLYKSYQARGYLEYLGQRAKLGTLPEADLPLTGWPGRRVKDWWREVWASAWLGKTADLLEPWMLLPWLFVFMWTSVLLKQVMALGTAMAVGLGAIASAAAFAALSVMLVGLQGPESSPVRHVDKRGPP